MVVRYQIVQRHPMRIDLAALRHPQSRRAPALRLRQLLFRQAFEQIFIRHDHSHRCSSYIDGITPPQPLQMLKDSQALRCSPPFAASLEGSTRTRSRPSFETPRKRAAPQDDGGGRGVIASQRVGAKRRPMTGSAKQSRSHKESLDCFVASAPRNDDGNYAALKPAMAFTSRYSSMPYL